MAYQQNNIRDFSVIAFGAVLLIASACQPTSTTPAQSTDEIQIAAGLIPCDTDSDCMEKNGDPDVEIEYCEAITKAGKRCSRKVNEAGLLCKQHSKMVKNGKAVKTVEGVN